VFIEGVLDEKRDEIAPGADTVIPMKKNFPQ
jgi:hypothetical protein